MATAYVREVGEGPGVVCLHSNASTSGQWRALADRLAERFRVFAVDGYGAGKSPPWPTEFAMHLEHEVALLEPVLERAGAPFHLVGHSYGGAVALRTALVHRDRVRSIVLYEPTVFHLLAAGRDPLQTPARGIWSAASAAAGAAERGDDDAAGEQFIDYWMGAGSWRAMPEGRRAAIAVSVRNVGGWRDALFADTTPLADYAALDVPVLYLSGEASPESAQAVTRVLVSTLPRVTHAPQAGLGHMGPITHPDRVNAEIDAFLQRHR
jgi:pimeloyl-ACP methyl ester carboxylesterase